MPRKSGKVMALLTFYTSRVGGQVESQGGGEGRADNLGRAAGSKPRKSFEQSGRCFGL